MKKLLRFANVRVGLIAVLAFAVAGTTFVRSISAATGSIYLSGATSVQKDSNVTVSINLNPGTAVDGVEATLTYDQSKLQFVSASGTGSAFPIELQQTGGSGTVKVSRGILGGSVSSNALVTQVTFKALAGGTSSNLSLSGNATYAGSYTGPAANGLTLNLTNPTTTTTTPTPTNTSTGAKPNTPSNTGSTANKPSETGSSNAPEEPKKEEPKISIDVEEKHVELNKATLNTKLGKQARVFVVFGTEQDQLKVSTKPTELGTEHDISLGDAFIIPGTTYYYKVVAEDEQGNKTESHSESFKTKGYTVRLNVYDAKGRPLAKKKVTLHSEPLTAETNDKGSVEFTNVAPGEHHLEYKQGDESFSAPVKVDADRVFTASDGTQTANTQFSEVVFDRLATVKSGNSLVAPIAIAAVLVLGAAGYLVLKRRGYSLPKFAGISDTNSTVAGPQGHPNGNDLFSRVDGPNKPDPGSVVKPKENNDDKDNN